MTTTPGDAREPAAAFEGHRDAEAAVIMPESRRLSTLVQAQAEFGDSLRAVARLLAVHHAQAPRSEAIDRAGQPAGLRRRWTDNLEALRAFQDVVGAAALDEIADRALRFVDGRHRLLEARVAAGRIRDGHGDLLADDIFCLPDGPRVLDCLEFDDDLRSVDGLDDAAGLAMDLERLGSANLGSRFVHWFAEFSGQTRVDSLVHHYTAYRAVVRMKVACRRWSQGHPAGAAEAHQLAEIALGHLRAGEPRLILVGGSPGTGKSTLASGLADRLGAVLLRSDRIRKERADLVPEPHRVEPWRSGLYAPEVTQALYADLVSRAGLLLQNGESVVLDASWSRAADREPARTAAATASSPLVELRCCAPVDVVDARIERRRASRDPSDVTPELARLIEQSFESWPEAVELRTTRAAPEVLDRAARIVSSC